jgi:CRP-like cAMP-binding protein
MFRNRSHRVPARRLELLSRIPMFANLPDPVLARIDSLVVEVDLEAGTVLTAENDPGREAFIITEGTAEVRVDGEVVAHASTGDLVGEMSLLDYRPRSATVVALTPLRVLVMDRGQFAALFQDPQAAQSIAASLSQRLRDANALR